MTKQQIQVLVNAEKTFEDLKMLVKEIIKAIHKNAETMDAAYTQQELVYEWCMEQMSVIHQKCDTMAADICADLVTLAVDARKEAD